MNVAEPIIRTEQLTKRFEAPPPVRGPMPGAGMAGRSAPATSGPPASSNGERRPAVDHLDLAVAPGEIFGLLGPNGAGKTTTIGMLTTRVVPTAGRAWVAGIDVVAEPAKTRQLIGVLSQTNTLDRALGVAENLQYHGRYFGMHAAEARRESERLLEQFQLAEVARANVATLSGGMAQRLMLARAIMHRPAVLFLDEPTAGLDPQGRLRLWELLRELNGQGQTIFLTTHYMEEADQLCRRVAIMDHGRILALDAPDELKRTVDADTVVTVGAATGAERLAGVLGGLEGATGAVVTPGGVKLNVRGGRRILPRVLEAADAAGIAVDDLSVAEPTLETVFISLTGKDLRD